MKTKIFFIAMLCLMLVFLQGVMLVNAKMGSITFHVFKDLNRNQVFDTDEPSPPWAIVKLKMQGDHPFFWFMVNRVRLVGGIGDVTYRFVQYPCYYRLVADYYYSPDGLGTYFWNYEGILHLDENNIGTTIYIPLKGGYVP
jgi:hypothetical protein